MSDQEKIDLILEWAERNRHFDTEFVESLQFHLDRLGYLTESQSAALDRIIERWKIEY